MNEPMEDQKKAAILGAISAYMQIEEVAASPAVKPPPSTISPWKIFGRQELMRTRGFWRSKVVSRSK